MEDRIGVEARIHGRVQGVWYRAWTREEAERRGLAGSVRNMPDGSVLARFVGPAAAVAAMVEACREGPPKARVERIDTAPLDPAPEVEGFAIER